MLSSILGMRGRQSSRGLEEGEPDKENPELAAGKEGRADGRKPLGDATQGRWQRKADLQKIAALRMKSGYGSRRESKSGHVMVRKPTDQAPVGRQNQAESESNAKESEVVSQASGRSPVGGFSGELLPDIDAQDGADPLLVPQYVKDIFAYLRALESQCPIREDYLSECAGVSWKMRAVLVDWLIQIHTRFRLLPETLFLTINVIDRYLQAVGGVPKEKLQLVGVTAMFVASKYEEMYSPEVQDFVYITDHTYKMGEILSMERELLRRLDFRLSLPLPIQFLRRFSKAADATALVHSVAKYCMESALLEASLCHFPPSQLAAAALFSAFSLLEFSKWSPLMEYFSGYSETALSSPVRRIARFLVSVHFNHRCRNQTVRTKYADERFLQASHSRNIDLEKLGQLATLP